MQGRSRLGGSNKYKNVGTVHLVPPQPSMVADPARSVKPEQTSLSYNNMLMRQNGGVMSHDNIKEMRKRKGFCLTCQNEPTQLYEIRKSKINPLFRGKEAIDALHESYNGTCLKCNPRMDPHHKIKRESMRNDFNRRSLVPRTPSQESLNSLDSRSRSSSPSPPSTPTPAITKILAKPERSPTRSAKPLNVKKDDSPTKREKTTRLQGKPTKDEILPPSRKGSNISNTSEATARISNTQETKLSKRTSVASLQDTRGSPTNAESEILDGWNSAASLGSLIQSTKPSINKSNMEDFSMPDFSQADFSQENTSFKSHRKKTKKKEAAAPNTSKQSKSKAGLPMVREERRLNGLEASAKFDSGSDLFADFSDPSFSTENGKLGQPSSGARKLIPTTANMQSPNDAMNDAGLPNEALTHANSDMLHRHTFGDDTSFFGEGEPNVFEKSDARLDSFPTDTAGLTRQVSDPFCSSWSSKNGLDGDEWPTALGAQPSDDTAWTAPLSIATEIDSEKSQPGSRPHFSSDDGSFMSLTSLASLEMSRHSIERVASEQSLSFHDAVLQTSKTPSRQVQRTPSQIIEADELIMSGVSGIKTEPAAAASLENNAEVEDLIALLQDVAAAGSFEILMDMLVTSIRENTNSIPIQEVCLKHIWDHSKFNDAHKSHIMEAGLSDDIIRAMQSHRKVGKIQEYACGCLWSLSVNKQNRVILARAGAIKLVFRALEEFIEDEEVLETIFGALRTLSPDKEVRDAIVSLLGARRVCRAMANHRSSTSIQRDGCAFLSNISVDIEYQIVSTVHKDELAAVVRALGDHLRNEAVVSSACFALKNYTYDEKNLRNLRRFEEVSSLLEDASKYSAKVEIRLDADEIRERLRLSGEEDDQLEEIAYSSLRDAMQSPQMTTDQAVETIRDILTQYEWSEKLICFSLGSLLSLSRQSEEYLTRITQFDVLKIVGHTMNKQQNNANIQQRGCETIKFLAEQGKRPRSMICDIDGIGVLATALRLHQNNASVKAVAVGALEELSKDPRCAQLINKEMFDKDYVSKCDHGNSFSSLVSSLGDSFSKINS
jgi:hypothetical protein